LILLVIPGPLQKGQAQSAQARGLPPIHWPDISKLEPEVRDQLTALEKSLTAAINKPDTTDAALQRVSVRRARFIMRTH
jgi:hypothetical protein